MRAGRFIALPNLVMQRRIVPEFLQEQATPEHLADEMERVLRDPARQYGEFLALFNPNLRVDQLVSDIYVLGPRGQLVPVCIDCDGALKLTVTASTRRPVQISFPTVPEASELREAILHHIRDALYHDDVHGRPVWRKHMTLRLAEQIRAELRGLL